METMRQLEAWWAYASKCAQLPANVPACDLFWNAIAIISATILALAALYIARAMLRRILAARAENARAAERVRVADADTMARYKADMDRLHAGVAEEKIEERIRQALNGRKAEGRPGASRDPEARG